MNYTRSEIKYLFSLTLRGAFSCFLKLGNASQSLKTRTRSHSIDYEQTLFFEEVRRAGRKILTKQNGCQCAARNSGSVAHEKAAFSEFRAADLNFFFCRFFFHRASSKRRNCSSKHSINDPLKSAIFPNQISNNCGCLGVPLTLANFFQQ